jgi:hypothetical protein
VMWGRKSLSEAADDRQRPVPDEVPVGAGRV